MIALSLRSLNGETQRVKLTPDTTISSLRTLLEQDVSFSDIRLLQGDRELLDGDAVELELQVIRTASPAKALSELERINQLEPEQQEAAADLATVALEVLDKEAELTSDVCDRLLVLPDGYHWLATPKPPAFLAHLGFTFGRACGDPIPYAGRLAEMLRMSYDPPVNCWAAKAGLEIARRCGRALPPPLFTALLGWARSNANCDSLATHFACDLLGFLGDETDENLLQDLVEHEEFGDDAVAALSQIRERSNKANGFHNPAPLLCTAEANLAGHGASVEGNNAVQQWIKLATMLLAAADDADHEALELDMALSVSEQAALLQEQKQLQETILRSKADCAFVEQHAESSEGADDGLVLLTFNRCPKELFDALLLSPLAARLTAKGVELQPAWASRQLIMAEGVMEVAVSEAREKWHVAVHAADEDDVHAVLRQVFGRDRPRVRSLDGRFCVPRGTSLFEVSDAGGAPEDFVFSSDDTWLSAEVTVYRTFVHFPAKSIAPRTSKSAPSTL